MASWDIDLEGLSLLLLKSIVKLLLTRKGLRIDPCNALLPFSTIYTKVPWIFSRSWKKCDEFPENILSLEVNLRESSRLLQVSNKIKKSNKNFGKSQKASAARHWNVITRHLSDAYLRRVCSCQEETFPPANAVSSKSLAFWRKRKNFQ